MTMEMHRYLYGCFTLRLCDPFEKGDALLLGKIKNEIMVSFRENTVLYLVVIFAFITGIATGSFTAGAMTPEQKDDLSGFLNRFSNAVEIQSLDRAAIFFESVWQHFKTVFFVWLFSIFFVFIPLILITVGIRGFLLGFTVGFIIEHYGFGGFLFSFICILPQTLIYVPCYILMGLLALKFGIEGLARRKVHRTREQKIQRLIPHSIKMMALFLLLLLGTLIETFITPIFLHLFKWVF